MVVCMFLISLYYEMMILMNNLNVLEGNLIILVILYYEMIIFNGNLMISDGNLIILTGFTL